MPDFERIIRELRIELLDEENAKLLRAEFKGEDRARWQVVAISLVIAIAYVIGWFILSGTAIAIMEQCGPLVPGK